MLTQGLYFTRGITLHPLVKTKSKYHKKYYKFWWKRLQTHRIYSIFIFSLFFLPKFPLQLALGMSTLTKCNFCHITFIILFGEIDRIRTESSTLQRMQVKQWIHILTRTRQGGKKTKVSHQSRYLYFTGSHFSSAILRAHLHPLHMFFRPHSFRHVWTCS